MKKILYIENEATVNASSFYKAALDASKGMGWEFHLAYHCLDYSEEAMGDLAKALGFTFHQIEFRRNPLHPGNLVAYKQLCKLVEQECFDIIHCNTPVGGVLGRLVANQKGISPVIYQAHGFHFYQGAPLQNWLLYYPAEKILARKTDAIITINREDYEFSKRHLHPLTYYVPGVGIEPDQWEKHNIIRHNFGLADDFVVLVVGRLEKNKNCGMVIEAVRKVEKARLVFCGDGEERLRLEKKTHDLGMQDRVIFLGNRKDMSDIYHMADCFVLASFREGLSRSIMEAMACGLPCIVSDIRGNRDLIDSQGGFLFNPTDVDALAGNIKSLMDSRELQRKMCAHNREKITEFSYQTVVASLTGIYKSLLLG